MRTKIMLALALVLAVALVGTARPVSGIEAAAAAAAPAETVLSSPAPFDIALADSGAAGTETGAAAQEKEQEKAKAAEKAERAAKEKAASAKTIIVKPVVVEGKPIEITITEGGEVKKLLIDKPLTITKSKAGDAIVLTVDGKDVQVLKGEGLRLEIKGGELKIAKEAGVVKVGEGDVFTIVKEGGDEARKVVTYGNVKPEVVVEATPHVIVKVGKDVKEGEPFVKTWIGEGTRAYAFTTGLGGAEMLEKVQALQEQVQAIKAKKMDLTALEESLKKLEAELRAKEEKLRDVQTELEKAPGEFTVVKRIGADEAEGKVGVWVYEKDKASQAGMIKVVAGSGDKGDGTISLIFTGQEGEAGKAAFERAIAALKKDLPEGHKLADQEYDAKTGTMTFKISAPEGKQADEKIVRKLVGTVKDAIKAEK